VATYSSKDVSFFQIAGRNVVGVMTTLKLRVSAIVRDQSGFGTTWPKHQYTGIRKFELSQSGFYDDAADSINAALSEQQGLLKVISFGLAGAAVGAKFVGFEGPLVTDYGRQTMLEDLHKADATYMGNGQVDDGVVLQPRAVKTADWNTESTSVDNAASSANGGAAYLQVEDLTLGGHTNLTVKIRHSVDNSTFADLLTMTAVTTARTAERKTVAGTVNRYLTVNGDYQGAGSPTSTVSVGFARF